MSKEVEDERRMVKLARNVQGEDEVNED